MTAPVNTTTSTGLATQQPVHKHGKTLKRRDFSSYLQGKHPNQTYMEILDKRKGSDGQA